MAKYKVGDKVKIIKNDNSNTRIGENAEVILIDPDDANSLYLYKLRHEGGNTSGEERWADHELEPVFVKRHKNTMAKLSSLARGAIDPNLRKIVKVGWLESDLTITNEGMQFAMSQYLLEKKVDFGKVADQILKDRKDEKDC